MDAARYDVEYVKSLFDRMGRTYDVMNVVSSFGLSEVWRWRCVSQVPVRPGQHVCDMMAGTGECWRYIRWRGVAAITSIDFSPFMVRKQLQRRSSKGATVAVLEENATATSLASASVDHVISAFGLKTLGPEALTAFAREIHRILKPGGHVSLLEISLPDRWLLRRLYRWYIGRAIPCIGRVFLGDLDCYRMLGEYTSAFRSCATVLHHFRDAGLEVTLKKHFFGCATSVVGRKPG